MSLTRLLPKNLAVKISLALMVLIPLLMFAGLAMKLTLEIRLRDLVSSLPGYEGGFGQMRLDLLAGEITLTDFHLNKDNQIAPGVRFVAKAATADIAWLRSIQARALSAQFTLEQPDLTLLFKVRRPGAPFRYGVWQKFFKPLVPFQFDRISVYAGRVRILNRESIPPTRLLFHDIQLTGENVANRPRLSSGKTAVVYGRGMMGNGKLRLRVEARPFQKDAEFDLVGSLKGFDLTDLNQYLRYSFGIDLQRGILSVAGRFSAKSGNFEGRVARVISHVDVMRSKVERQGFVEGIKEFFLEKWAERKAGPDKRFEAVYRLTGPLGYRSSDVFLAAVWVVRSAFLNSLRPELPSEVALGRPEDAAEKSARRQAELREKERKN